MLHVTHAIVNKVVQFTDGDLIVYAWMYKYVTKEWKDTAITRAKDFNNIKFSKKEKRDIEEAEIQRYFDKRLNSVWSRETGCTRNEEGYVNVQWFMGQLKTDAPTVMSPS